MKTTIDLAAAVTQTVGVDGLTNTHNLNLDTHPRVARFISNVGSELILAEMLLLYFEDKVTLSISALVYIICTLLQYYTGA